MLSTQVHQLRAIQNSHKPSQAVAMEHKACVVKRAANMFTQESSQIARLNLGNFTAYEKQHIHKLAARKVELLNYLYQTALELERVNTQQLDLAATLEGN